MKAKPLEVFHGRYRETQAWVALESELTVVGWLAQHDSSLRSNSLKTLKPSLDNGSANSTVLLVIHNSDRAKTEPACSLPIYGHWRKRYVADNFTLPIGYQRNRQGTVCAQRLNYGSFCATRMKRLRKG